MPVSSSREGSAPNRAIVTTWGDDHSPIVEYESPCIIDIGHVRELTGGSSSSGSADANSQYYW